MPFALYSTLTGQILTVLPWKKPQGVAQLSALQAQNLAFMEVDKDITPTNSIVDLELSSAIPRGPARTIKTRHIFNPDTGEIVGWHSAAFLENDPLLSEPNVVVTDTGGPHPDLANGNIIELNNDKTPKIDQDGKLKVTIPEPKAQLPDKNDLLLLAAIRAGNLDPSELPEDVKSKTNSALNAAGIAPI